MRIDAALADQLETRQALEQRRADFRAFPYQHQNFGVAQPLSQCVGVLDVIVPDRDVAAVELAKARQGAQRVLVIVKYRDFHGSGSLGSVGSTRHYILTRP